MTDHQKTKEKLAAYSQELQNLFWAVSNAGKETALDGTDIHRKALTAISAAEQALDDFRHIHQRNAQLKRCSPELTDDEVRWVFNFQEKRAENELHPCVFDHPNCAICDDGMCSDEFSQRHPELVEGGWL